MLKNCLSFVIVTQLVLSVVPFKIDTNLISENESQLTHYPSHGYLEAIEGYTKTMRCGCTLIGDRWILTAAHCLEEADWVEIHLGQLNSDANRISLKVFKNNFHRHPLYLERMYKNDIALIKTKPITFDKFIKPAKFPTACGNTENLEVISIGNGRSKNEIIQRHLQLTTIGHEKCSNLFPKKFEDDIICAENDRNGFISYSDGGNPLIRKDDGSLIGVGSAVFPNYSEFKYSRAFTDILAYSEWISKETGFDLPICKADK